MRVKNNNLVENFIECMHFAKYFEKSRIDVYESTLKKTEIYRLWKNTTVTIKTGKAIIRQAGLHCGYLCNKHVAIAMDLLTRFPKLCFACTYINIVFFFFFLGTTGQDSKKSLRRISQITSIFFSFSFCHGTSTPCNVSGRRGIYSVRVPFISVEVSP